jgi:SPP1 gp7 family putative phage head morphogenesis protein
MPLEDAVADPADDPGSEPGKPGAPDESPNDPNGNDANDDREPDEAPEKPAPKKNLKSVEDAREGKVFNLPSDRAKQREARGQIRLRAGFQRKMLRQVQAVFEIEGHRVAKAVEGLDAHHAESAARREIEANRPQWKTVLTRNYQGAMEAFGQRVFRSMKSITGPDEIKAGQTKYEEFLKKWIEEHVGEQIDLIDDTTKDEILEAIRDAQLETYDEGEGARSLSEKIQEIYDGFTESRAMTIARTEMGVAANTALNAAAKSTGIPGLQKEWVSVNDDRTRPDHVDANGQVVPMDGKFKVGGVELDYPCDPSGPPDEIINCRCAQVFSREKSDDNDSGNEDDTE